MAEVVVVEEAGGREVDVREVNVRQQAPSGINTEESIQNIWRELESEER